MKKQDKAFNKKFNLPDHYDLIEKVIESFHLS